MPTQPIQPNLFEWLAPNSSDEIRRKGQSVIRELRKVQRKLDGAQTAYSHFIDRCAAEIGSHSRLSDHQREQLILIAVEQQGATSIAEICEDTKIDKESVIKIVCELGNRKILYRAKKPGSELGGKPVYIIKSRRAGVPEMGEI